MSTAANPERRWLKSAIAAASNDQSSLPWANTRAQRPADAQPAGLIRIVPSAPALYSALAAR